jgi:transcriptional regulator with XRE-family HTH domain
MFVNTFFENFQIFLLTFELHGVIISKKRCKSMILAQRIKQRREELHLSQEELAKKLGYKSRSTINKIEMGKNDITQHKIAAFAKALQTTPAYLMGWEEENSPEEPKLTVGERMLLELFRQIPEEQQKHFLEIGRAYANSLKKD